MDETSSNAVVHKLRRDAGSRAVNRFSRDFQKNCPCAAAKASETLRTTYVIPTYVHHDPLPSQRFQILGFLRYLEATSSREIKGVYIQVQIPTGILNLRALTKSSKRIASAFPGNISLIVSSFILNIACELCSMVLIVSHTHLSFRDFLCISSATLSMSGRTTKTLELRLSLLLSLSSIESTTS